MICISWYKMYTFYNISYVFSIFWFISTLWLKKATLYISWLKSKVDLKDLTWKNLKTCSCVYMCIVQCFLNIIINIIIIFILSYQTFINTMIKKVKTRPFFCLTLILCCDCDQNRCKHWQPKWCWLNLWQIQKLDDELRSLKST